MSEYKKLFISIPQRYSFTVAHFTNAGNEYVSRKIYEALAANPEVAAKLARLH
jgi:hypothetical protein